MYLIILNKNIVCHFHWLRRLTMVYILLNTTVLKSGTRSQIYVKNKRTLLFLRPLWLSGRVPFVNVQHVNLSSSLILIFLWGHTRVHNFGHFCLSVITHLVSLSLPSLLAIITSLHYLSFQ